MACFDLSLGLSVCIKMINLCKNVIQKASIKAIVIYPDLMGDIADQ